MQSRHSAGGWRSQRWGLFQNRERNAGVLLLRIPFVASIGVALRGAGPTFPATLLNQELPHMLAQVALVRVTVGSLAIAKRFDAFHQFKASASDHGIDDRMVAPVFR